MTSEEKTKIIQLLQVSQQETLSIIENLSEAQWAFKAAPEQWSVAEIGEHILLAEALMFGQVTQALAAAENPEWETKTAGKTEFLEKVMPIPLRKAQAPAPIIPAGQLSKEEFVEQFKLTRAKTLQFTLQCDESLHTHTTEHPFPIFNTLSAYQWLLYIPLHNQRHNRQIDEVKTMQGLSAL